MAARQTCELCSCAFSDLSTLRRHYRTKHHGYSISANYLLASRISCEFCDSTFSSLWHLRRHQKLKHSGHYFSEISHSSRRTCLKCSICSSTLSKSSEFNNHLINDHDIILDCINITFKDANEFESWKKSVEEEQNSYFVKNTGNTRPVSDSGTTIAHYQCNRSGNYRGKSLSTTKRERLIKFQGSSKINAYCPARIKANFNSDGSIHVSFCKTHVGHEADLAHIPLPNDTRKLIASKIAQKTPFEEIINDVQASVSGKIKRKHILNKQDLRNITKEYSLDSECVHDSEDALSTEACVDEFRTIDNSRYILLYKPNIVESSDYPQLTIFHLNKEDDNKSQTEAKRETDNDTSNLVIKEEENYHEKSVIIEPWVEEVTTIDNNCILLCKPNRVESSDYPQLTTVQLTKENGKECQAEAKRDIENDNSKLIVEKKIKNYRERCLEKKIKNYRERCVLDVSKHDKQFHDSDLDSQKQKASDSVSIIISKIQSFEQLHIFNKGLKSIELQVDAVTRNGK